MLSVSKKIEQGTVFGVTPFYYMLFSEGAKESVNSIVAVMPIDITLNFINNVEQIAETILFISDVNNMDKLSDEDREILEDENVMRYFIESVEKNAIAWADGLTDIKQRSSETYSEIDFLVGSATIKGLLSMTAPDMEKRMRNELSPYLQGPMGDSNSLDSIEYLDKSLELIEQIKAGIVLIDRKLDKLGVNDKARDTSYLTQRIKTIINEVQYLDHLMVNYEGTYITTLRKNLTKLGLNTRINLYPDVNKQKSEVASLFSKKNYNNSTRISLESKRNCFERNIVTLSSKIEAVRIEASTDMYYF